MQSGNRSNSRPFALASGTHSRINPVSAYPEYLSICSKQCPNGNCSDIGNFEQGSVAPEIFPNNATYNLSKNLIVCGEGSGATITAGNGERNVLDAGLGSTQGASLTGGPGIDLLYGTGGNNTIEGGAGNDILVGRCGADSLQGGNGTNHYLPWDDGCAAVSGSTTITGGGGTDIAFLRGPRSDHSYSATNCDQSNCPITKGGLALSIISVEVIVFDDMRLDVPRQ